MTSESRETADGRMCTEATPILKARWRNGAWTADKVLLDPRNHSGHVKGLHDLLDCVVLMFPVVIGALVPDNTACLASPNRFADGEYVTIGGEARRGDRGDPAYTVGHIGLFISAQPVDFTAESLDGAGLAAG